MLDGGKDTTSKEATKDGNAKFIPFAGAKWLVTEALELHVFHPMWFEDEGKPQRKVILSRDWAKRFVLWLLGQGDQGEVMLGVTGICGRDGRFAEMFWTRRIREKQWRIDYHLRAGDERVCEVLVEVVDREIYEFALALAGILGIEEIMERTTERRSRWQQIK